MKILVSVCCSDEWVDLRPSYAILDVTESLIELIERRYEHIRPVFKESSFYSAEFFDYSCVWLDSVPEDLDLPDDFVNRMCLWTHVPEDFDPEEDMLSSTSCDCMVITENEVWWKCFIDDTSISCEFNDSFSISYLKDILQGVPAA